jgi:glutamate racemase
MLFATSCGEKEPTKKEIPKKEEVSVIETDVPVKETNKKTKQQYVMQEIRIGNKTINKLVPLPEGMTREEWYKRQKERIERQMNRDQENMIQTMKDNGRL